MRIGKRLWTRPTTTVYAWATHRRWLTFDAMIAAVCRKPRFKQWVPTLPPSHADIIALVIAGDARGWIEIKAILSELRPKLARYKFTYSEMDDLMAEVLIESVKDLRRYGGIRDPEKLVGWLWGVSRFKAMDLIKAKIKYRQRFYPWDLTSNITMVENQHAKKRLSYKPERSSIDPQGPRLAALRLAMPCLRPIDRELLTRYTQGESKQRIQTEMQLTDKQYRVRKHRAIRQLMEGMKDMGQTTGIEWCDSTFNPWWGCTKVSDECDHCYAADGSNRYGFKIWGHDAPRRFFGDHHWNQPLKWNAEAKAAGVRRRVFAGSYCDVMEDRRDLDPHRKRLYERIEQTDWIDWLLVSKLPQNFKRLCPPSWIDSPPRNVWAITTVGTAKSLWRIDAIKTAPAAIRGLSIEPLLMDLPTIGEHLDGIDWCIVGGESGHQARAMEQDWARRIRDECLSRKIAFFFKQWGEFGPSGDVMVRMGKKNAGSTLDGQQWKEFPDGRP